MPSLSPRPWAERGRLDGAGRGVLGRRPRGGDATRGLVGQIPTDSATILIAFLMPAEPLAPEVDLMQAGTGDDLAFGFLPRTDSA